MNYTTTLVRKEPIASDTMAFHFEKPAGFTFSPGQHIDLATPVGSSDFSIASAPSDPDIMLAMRMRESPLKKAVAELALGSSLSFRGPLGSFMLHEDTSRPAIFLAGGIGITPFISMTREAVVRGLKHRMGLFYSNRSPIHAAFLDELTARAAAFPNLTFVPTMSGDDAEVGDWKGETGYITMDLIHRYMAEREGAVYYIAGPAAMTDALHNLLKTVSVPETDIRIEEFRGY